MPKVNPEVLTWARKSMALTIKDSAKKIGLQDTVRVSAQDKLAAIERGEKEPTQSQLLSMSKKYHVPLLTLYLSHPPRQGDRGEDFRTLPAAQLPGDNVYLNVLIRNIKARQSLLRETLIQEDETEPVKFVGTVTVQDGVPYAAKRLHKVLGFSLSQFRRQSTIEDAFKYVRKCAEEQGVFVLLVSNLGSYHTNINVATFRGFALADEIAPFIVINDQDSKAAWTFTLLHEMVHLLLAQTGVSDPYSDNRIEKFCNGVASEILLPANEMDELNKLVAPHNNAGEIIDAISGFKHNKNISNKMVAYRLYRSGTITRRKWIELDQRLNEFWLEQEEFRRKRRKDSENDKGPNYYVVRRHKLGNPLVNITRRMMDSGALTCTQAGFLLDTKPIKVHRIFQTRNASYM